MLLVAAHLSIAASNQDDQDVDDEGPGEEHHKWYSKLIKKLMCPLQRPGI